MPNSSRWAECGGCTGPRRQLRTWGPCWCSFADPLNLTWNLIHGVPHGHIRHVLLDLAQLGSRLSLGGDFRMFLGPNLEASNFLQRRLLLELSWQSVFLHPTLSATGFNWKEYNAFELADTAKFQTRNVGSCQSSGVLGDPAWCFFGIWTGSLFFVVPDGK